MGIFFYKVAVTEVFVSKDLVTNNNNTTVQRKCQTSFVQWKSSGGLRQKRLL